MSHSSASQLIKRTVCVALCLSMLQAQLAFAWTTRPETEWDTHDWLAHQSISSAHVNGFGWADPSVAVDWSQNPDASAVPTYTCDWSEPSHVDIPAQVADLYAQALAAYREGRFADASALAGRISHLTADLGDPSFVAQWASADSRTAAWRAMAFKRTKAAWQNNGWIDRRAPERVYDVRSWLRGLEEDSRERVTGIDREATSGDIGSLEMQNVLADQLNEIAFRTSSLYASIQADAQDEIVPTSRVAASNRYGTAVETSRRLFPSGCDTAVLVSGHAWPDALAATSIAGIADAPILLSGRFELTQTTRDELDRLGASSVIVVGGPGVVADRIVTDMRSDGLVVSRLWGSDRFQTSTRVAAYAKELDPDAVSTAYVCTGGNFVDALAIGQITCRTGNIVMLVRPGLADQAVAAEASALGVRRAVVIGGPSAVLPGVESRLATALGATNVQRVAGEDRYATSLAVLDLRNELFDETASYIAVASGTSFADGLTGGPLAAQDGWGLLLSRPTRLPMQATEWVTRSAPTIEGFTILGGLGAIGGFVEYDLQHALDPTPIEAPVYEAFEPTVTVRYSPASDLHGQTLGLYYTDLSPQWAVMCTWPRDVDQVVMVEYGWLSKPVYNPVSVALCTVAACDEFLLRGTPEAREDIIRQADWLSGPGMDSQGRFPYLWDYGARNLKAPWYSAMAQGMGISALLRAYQIIGDEAYLTAAREALAPFNRTVANGGVTTISGDDLWLEEYTEAEPKQVLNGAIWAMWGLWDLYRVTGDSTARSLFDRSVATLERHLSDYESNGSVLYERYPGHYANHYHMVHIRQLRALTGITGDLAFADSADRWSLLPPSPPVPTALQSPFLDPNLSLMPDDLLEPYLQ